MRGRSETWSAALNVLKVLSSLYVAFLPGVKSLSLHSVSVGWLIREHGIDLS